MNNKYDVAIIGGGPSAIFAAYELISKDPEMRVIMIEEGHDIYHRECPIAAKKVTRCINCKMARELFLMANIILLANLVAG